MTRISLKKTTFCTVFVGLQSFSFETSHFFTVRLHLIETHNIVLKVEQITLFIDYSVKSNLIKLL